MFVFHIYSESELIGAAFFLLIAIRSAVAPFERISQLEVTHINLTVAIYENMS